MHVFLGFLGGENGKRKWGNARRQNNSIEEIEDRDSCVNGEYFQSHPTCQTQSKEGRIKGCHSQNPAYGSADPFNRDRGRGAGFEADVPLLSEQEKKELVALVTDQNISMDFILEMKEAFLLFDKVLQ